MPAKKRTAAAAKKESKTKKQKGEEADNGGEEVKAVAQAESRMSREPRLQDKVCIISGASRGFGQTIAVRFVEEGAKVVLMARSSCDETIEQIKAIQGFDPNTIDDVVLYAKGDISSEDEIAALVKATNKKFGKAVHVLVNNAAAFIFKSVESASAEDWDNTCAVNIKGHMLLTKALLPSLKAANGASIVFQGSISSFLAQPECITYSATKAAIVQLARNCAYDLAKYNIRSNAVCAGTVETPISEVERRDHGWTFDEWEKLKTKDVMLKRVGNTREVANATLFFACNESTYCTGTTLMVDGGQTACTVMVD